MRYQILWITTAVLLVITITLAALLWPSIQEMNPVSPEVRRDVLTEIGSTYRPEEAAFHVRLNGIVNPHRLTSAFVLPRDSIVIGVERRSGELDYSVDISAGTLLPTGNADWIWHAPDSAGVYPIHIDEHQTASSVTINAFVMVPYDLDDEELAGFRIGQYERTLHRGDSAYLPPRGFIRAMPEDLEVLVSPHFKLGQFVSKQESGWPKFLLIRERLLHKLEFLLREINERGIHAPTLHVMSAFRTPFYNTLIGNTTNYSRHLYGGAADIFVDADEDGYMDDLDGDGEITRRDAVYLAQIIESHADEPWFEPFVGGLGIYGPAPYRGPFVHVDVRGVKVRW